MTDQYKSDTEQTALTFESGTEEFVINAFGWELTNTGYIWDEDIVPSITGEPVHIDELAGVVQFEGEPRPLRDDFNELVDYVKHRHETTVGSTTETDQ